MDLLKQKSGTSMGVTSVDAYKASRGRLDYFKKTTAVYSVINCGKGVGSESKSAENFEREFR